MRALLLAPAVVVVVGCVPAPVYQVQRSARVPRPAAPLRTGEPLSGPIELSIAATAGGGNELADEGAAVEVPRQQVRSELRIRVRRGEITPFYEQAIESSYSALDPTQAPVREGTATAIGLATRYSFATPDPNLSIGTALEFMSYSMPYVEYRSCVQYCEENGVYGTTMHSGTESTGSFGLGITPTYRTGRVAFFGGMYARRHPTIERKGQEIGGEYDQDITGGNYNFMLHAGLEVRASVFSLSATIQQDLTRDPVQYGPSVGFALAVHVPDFELPPASRPDEPAPAPPSAPSWLVRGVPVDGDSIDDGALPDDPW